jgi:hypothetical protein
MSTQLLPLTSQARHRYVNEVGLPDQVPTDAVNVCATWAVPESDGDPVLAGAAMSTCPDDAEVADVEPPAFVAVTTIRSVLATSDALSK